MQPTVSVLMPVYNSEIYLREAVDSILQQSYTDFELLVFDDGSTDATISILESYTDERIQIFSDRKNLGQPKRYNAGIERAKGKYIAIMHADDIALPHRLATQIAFMEANQEYDLVGAGIYFMHQSNTSIKRRALKGEHSDYLYLYRLFNCPFYHPTIVFRAKIMQQFRYDETFVSAEDYELWSRMLNTCKSYNIPEALLHYRLHGNNNAERKRAIQRRNVQVIYQRMFQQFEVAPSAEELRTHMLIWEGHFAAYTKTELEAIEQWLIKLKKRLENKTGEPVEQVIRDIWFSSCKRRIPNAGLRTILEYKKSSLSDWRSLSIRQKMVFRLQCFAHEAVFYSIFRFLKNSLKGNQI